MPSIWRLEPNSQSDQVQLSKTTRGFDSQSREAEAEGLRCELSLSDHRGHLGVHERDG